MKMECPKCKKQSGYVRVETKEWVCRGCGTVSPLVLKEKAKKTKQPEIKIEQEKKEIKEPEEKAHEPIAVEVKESNMVDPNEH